VNDQDPRRTQQALAAAELALVRVVHHYGARPRFVLLGGLVPHLRGRIPAADRNLRPAPLKSASTTVEVPGNRHPEEGRAMRWALSDYLAMTPAAAESQWRSIRERREPADGVDQVDYVPVETLLCAAAMLVVGARSYGGSSAGRAPSPVPELSLLFRRSIRSIPNKMANLDGSRPKGARHDYAVWLALHADQPQLAHLYRVVLAGGRAAGLSPDALPDFLGIEGGGEVHLLGQEEIGESVIDLLLQSELDSFRATGAALDSRPTDRDIITKARIGQHRFARGVMDNCGNQCVFCGFHLDEAKTALLLRASHIKPWRDSVGAERLDVRNGVAACPTHDAAFDDGLLTFDARLRIRVSERLLRARHQAVRTCFDPPILRERLELGPRAATPKVDYVRWHELRVFVD